MKDISLSGYPILNYKSCYEIPEGPYSLEREHFEKRIYKVKKHLLDQKIDGLLVSRPHNIIYLSGLHFIPTERPMALYVPADDRSPLFLIPRIDEDIVRTWWLDDFCSYFDYPLSDGDFADPGKPVDMPKWFADAFLSRKFRPSVLGGDDLSVVEAIKSLTHIDEIRDLSEYLLWQRIIKDPEELDLMRRAIAFGDLIIEYGYHLIHKFGTDLRDIDLLRMTRAFGEDLMFNQIGPDGSPHRGAGTAVDVWCRAGLTTAFPHPNQPSRIRLGKNQPVQLALVVRLGGYGGEYYRAWHIAPMDSEARRMHEVHTRVTLLQQKLSSEGRKASEIASECLSYYESAGLSECVYHRPGHGQGVEGHQPPYISLGDNTVLQRGMCWSNEPGLYNVCKSIGYNHSNLIITGSECGEVPNRWPLSLDHSLIYL